MYANDSSNDIQHGENIVAKLIVLNALWYSFGAITTVLMAKS